MEKQTGRKFQSFGQDSQQISSKPQQAIGEEQMKQREGTYRMSAFLKTQIGDVPSQKPSQKLAVLSVIMRKATSKGSRE